jgi:S1-C subfamily serine protease
LANSPSWKNSWDWCRQFLEKKKLNSVMAVKFFRIAVLFKILLIPSWQAKSETIESYEISGWSIKSNTYDVNGKFGFCIASSAYKSGATLSYVVNDEYEFYLMMNHPKIRFSNQKSYEFLFKVDQGKIYNFTATASSDHTVIVDLKGDAAVFEQMRHGRTLVTSVMGRQTAFSLDGTARALEGLVKCVQGAGRPSSSTADVGEVPNEASSIPKSPEEPVSGSIVSGSGFFISATGEGLTNAHVLKGCGEATISGYGVVRIVARDESNDLALVQLRAQTSTPFAHLRRKPLQLGETVYALGFPLAGKLDNGLNFTSGLVSSLAGIGNDTRFLQFTAPIQPGNSGGPIVDTSGLVVGITKSKLNDLVSLNDNGALPQNVNFGIKADMAGNFIRANNSQLPELENSNVRDATEIANEGRGYTFQIQCRIE